MNTSEYEALSGLVKDLSTDVSEIIRQTTLLDDDCSQTLLRTAIGANVSLTSLERAIESRGKDLPRVSRKSLVDTSDIALEVMYGYTLGELLAHYNPESESNRKALGDMYQNTGYMVMHRMEKIQKAIEAAEEKS